MEKALNTTFLLAFCALLIHAGIEGLTWMHIAGTMVFTSALYLLQYHSISEDRKKLSNDITELKKEIERLDLKDKDLESSMASLKISSGIKSRRMSG